MLCKFCSDNPRNRSIVRQIFWKSILSLQHHMHKSSALLSVAGPELLSEAYEPAVLPSNNSPNSNSRRPSWCCNQRREEISQNSQGSAAMASKDQASRTEYVHIPRALPHHGPYQKSEILQLDGNRSRKFQGDSL